MARFNEILVGRYNRAVQKLFSMKGPASLRTLADEMMPVFPFSNGVDNRYLESWERFGFAASPTGGAAQNSAVALFNPAGSNIVGIVEQIVVYSTAGVWNASVQSKLAATLTTPITPSPYPDLRQRQNSSLLGSTTTNATGTGFTLYSLQQAINVPVFVIQNENQEIPITPGTGIQVFNGTQATVFTVSISWRERFFEDSERT